MPKKYIFHLKHIPDPKMKMDTEEGWPMASMGNCVGGVKFSHAKIKIKLDTGESAHRQTRSDLAFVERSSKN